MKRRFYLLLFLLLTTAFMAGCGAADVQAPTAEPTAAAAVETPSPTAPVAEQPEEPYPAPVLPTITPLPDDYPAPPTAPPPTAYPEPEDGTTEAPPAAADGTTVGLVYDAEDGLQQIGPDGEPVELAAQSGLEPVPDLSRAAYIAGGDVFVLDLETGESVNVTEGSGRTHQYVVWWPAQPDLLLTGSQGAEDAGPNNGALTLVGTDGSDYRVVAEEVGFALPEGSPDGTTIAYDEAGQPVMYDVTAATRTPFDVTAFTLPEGVTIERAASAAWSPDGNSLAIMMGILRDGGPGGEEIALGIFDLEGETAQVLHPYVTVGRGGWFEAPSWSPDGAWLAFPVETGDDTRGVWVTAADGSSEQLLGGNGFSPGIWSPDSSALALTPAESQDEILLFTAQDWSLQRVPLPHMRLITWAE